MMIPTIGVLVFGDHLLGIADQYGSTVGFGTVRFCHRCSTAAREIRCFVCGRSTTTELPPGWRSASAQTVMRMEGSDEPTARPEVADDDIDYYYGFGLF